MTMKLKDLLIDLCREHDLTCISVNFHLFGVGHSEFYAVVHWKDVMGCCVTETGETPEGAISKAIAEANVRREKVISITDEIEVEDGV